MPEPAEHRSAHRVQAGERELHLGFDASAARAIRHRSAVADRCRNRAVMPTPTSPRRTRTPLLARTHSRNESIKRVALALAVEQPRRWKARVEHARPALSRARFPALRRSQLPDHERDKRERHDELSRSTLV